ncbi:MAG: DNA cytosine methyltransferase [Endozoicomonadaceae bacterium]|nr:DNA cytosine methyltransferase [Endozoicomonadaceae bacterium]
MTVSCVDLFCGAGGLTHGFVKEGVPVVAGIDLDEACSYPYEQNNDSKFINKNVCDFSVSELSTLFGDSKVKILAGCAPCQPFSTYSQRYDINRNERWSLLNEFSRLSEGTKPDVITMENVPSVRNHQVFLDFVSSLESNGYYVWHRVVDSSQYGVAQTRKRLVLLASLYGEIELIEKTHIEPITVKKAIGKLKPLQAGESAKNDRLHSASELSEINLKRIQASKPGGTWKDWPSELIAPCHKASSGQTYTSVYGRMEWDKPGPTMTTQCYGFGNGRFGHPEQDRAITLREAAILQGFPKDYKFIPPGQKFYRSILGRMIGNAVPVGLGQAIAKSIKLHLKKHGKTQTLN